MTVRPIRLPIVISSDGTQAVAGLQQFSRLGQQLDRSLSKWTRSQASVAGGMLMGYLGIDAALNGMHKLYAEADRLQELARKYSPEVAQAYGARRVAEHERDKRVAQAITPIAVERERSATEMATSGADEQWAGVVAGLGSVLDQYAHMAKYEIAALTAATPEDSTRYREASGDIRQSINDSVIDFAGLREFRDWGADLLGFTPAQADTTAQSPATTVHAREDSTALKIADGINSMLAELRAIASHTRGQR